MSANRGDGSKSANFETNVFKSDKALPEAIVNYVPEDAVEISDEEAKQIAVYDNGLTDIDFMMPEKEKQILENNINVFENVEKTNKILKQATSNMRIRQGIKELEQIDKLGEIIESGQLKLNQMLECIDLESYKNLQSSDPEAASKAIKNVSIALSSMMQVRDSKVKSLKGSTSNKKVRIGIVFKNDDGEETSLGVEM